MPGALCVMKTAVKMDIDSIDSVDRGPLEKLSLVDVNQWKSSVWSMKTEKSVVVLTSNVYSQRLYNLSLVDIDSLKTSVWSTLTVDRRPLYFLGSTLCLAFHHARRAPHLDFLYIIKSLVQIVP